MAASTVFGASGWTGFERFIYRGSDPHADKVGTDQYLNPILAGFYPDPSICRVGEDYYLVNSTFAWWPGVPIFHSRDLVHWKQLGHILTRPSQLKLDGRQVSEGIFAPAITHHDGLFYMITTGVWAGGNFFVTAKDPAGPWSDPVSLPGINGIDPSLVFDQGKTYVVHNGEPPDNKPLYDGHRTIRLQQIDIKTGQNIGESRVLINGGVKIEDKPVWIEGPHIYKIGDWYYLTCAEGGTGPQHSQVIFRSKTVDGPYIPYEHNPILTQRNLPNDRPDPVTCVGHADIIDTPDGKWWAVFLGVRPYEHDHYNTGRETFLLPVEWKDGWPIILNPGKSVPRVVSKPNLASGGDKLTGNFEARDEFDGTSLGLGWMSLRGPWDSPDDTWAKLEGGVLRLAARTPRLTEKSIPSLIARRQQHLSFSAETEVIASEENCEAGLTAIQNEKWHFFLGVKFSDGQAREVFLERAAGATPELIARLPLTGNRIQLKIEARGRDYTFHARTPDSPWQQLGEKQDGTTLSTSKAGGFVGAMLGLHVRK